MKNKTSRECWTILRSEPDSAIDRYVPMKRQGKLSKKKLSERLYIFQITVQVKTTTP